MACPMPPVPGPEPASVELHDPACDAEWDAYVQAHGESSLYHTTQWRDTVHAAFGKEAVYLVARNPARRLCGVLPLIRQKSRLFGDRLVSLPYCNYGGPRADSTPVAEALYAAAAAQRLELGAARVEIRDDRPRDLDWPSRTDKVLMTRPLPADVATLDAELGTKLRAQVNRCRREQPEVLHGGPELLPAFYAVFARNMRDLGTPVYPRCWFEAVTGGFRGAAHIVVVKLQGRPAAAALLLRWRDTVEIPWAASLREHAREAPNMLLYREALGWAVGQGATRFDFGRSTRDEGTYRFKAQWGATPAPLYWYEQGAGAGAPGGGRREQFAAAWRRLPLWLANRLGPRITADLPW